jgi:hypothetical protein
MSAQVTNMPDALVVGDSGAVVDGLELDTTGRILGDIACSGVRSEERRGGGNEEVKVGAPMRVLDHTSLSDHVGWIYGATRR